MHCYCVLIKMGELYKHREVGKGREENELWKYVIQDDPSTRQRPRTMNKTLATARIVFPSQSQRDPTLDSFYFRIQGHRTPSQKWFTSLSHQFVVLCHCSPSKLVYLSSQPSHCTVKFENFLSTLFYNN